MRTKTVSICGKDYTINRAISVDLALEARGMSFDDVKNKPSTVLFVAMLAEMLKAGYEWEKSNGREANQPPKESELQYMLDADEMAAMIPAMMEVCVGVRNVQAKPAKKAKAGDLGA